MDKSDVIIPEGMETFYERLHFAPAVRDGNRLYCAGVIGIGADGVPPADPEAQFTRAFELLQSVLVAGGASFANLRAFAKVKNRFLLEPYPAWTAIGVSELAVPGALVEIKVVARLRG